MLDNLTYLQKVYDIKQKEVAIVVQSYVERLGYLVEYASMGRAWRLREDLMDEKEITAERIRLEAISRACRG
jgi:hypothetical protein